MIVRISETLIEFRLNKEEIFIKMVIMSFGKPSRYEIIAGIDIDDILKEC